MSPMVETSGGVVEGHHSGDHQLFRSIPYAAAPIGPLAFAPPSPLIGWTGVRAATDAGPVAVQVLNPLETMLYGQPPAMSQDCLTLTVTTPACDHEKRPVMVWLHGGGFVTGSESLPWYGGTAFARDGVVLVSVNYRLNAFGFCHFADMTSDERFATTGINGSLDQIAALGWVRDNIENFGGDPHNVTIFGESAGGCSVITLMTMPTANGLYQRAIAQSASFTQLRDRDRATVRARQLLDAIGVATPQALLGLDDNTILNGVAHHLAHALDDGDFDYYAPTFGVGDLSVDPRQVFSSGEANPVPLLIGTNRDEMNMFTMVDPRHHSLDEAGLAKKADHIVGAAAHALIDTYRTVRADMTVPQLASQIATDFTFRMPAIAAAQAHSHVAPTFMYEFHWPTPIMGAIFGSCHALEIPFVFDNLAAAQVFTGEGPERQSIATRMHAAWVAFAKSSTPQHDQLTRWPRYDAALRATHVFDTTDATIDDPDSALRHWWENSR